MGLNLFCFCCDRYVFFQPKELEELKKQCFVVITAVKQLKLEVMSLKKQVFDDCTTLI